MEHHCKLGARVTCSGCHAFEYRAPLSKEAKNTASWTAALHFTPDEDTFGVFSFSKILSLSSVLIPYQTVCRSEEAG